MAMTPEEKKAYQKEYYEKYKKKGLKKGRKKKTSSKIKKRSLLDLSTAKNSKSKSKSSGSAASKSSKSKKTKTATAKKAASTKAISYGSASTAARTVSNEEFAKIKEMSEQIEQLKARIASMSAEQKARAKVSIQTMISKLKKVKKNG